MMVKRYVVYYGKKKQGIVLAGSRADAIQGAFGQYGKHRKDRVHVFRYLTDLQSERLKKTSNKSVF